MRKILTKNDDATNQDDDRRSLKSVNYAIRGHLCNDSLPGNNYFGGVKFRNLFIQIRKLWFYYTAKL